MESQSETTQTVSALKLPILKTGDYDLWSMRMEQYLTHTDYALWEVIVNGDAPAAVASASTGAEGPIPPKTAEQKIARKNELKAKSTLLLAILDDHLLKFMGITTRMQSPYGKLSRIEGLDKTYDRFQKFISQLEIQGEVISQEDANLKLLRSLPLAWNNIALIMRNKSDLDTLSMDDLYNNLKVYKSEIKGKSSSSSNSQNVAFVSTDNSSSTNEIVNTAHSVSAASSKDQASTASYANDVMFSFFANQSNYPQLDYEDLEHIDADDLEEMDLKWQVAMLTMRVKRFIKKTGRKMDLNDKGTVGFDRTKVECYNCYRRGHFARECRAPRNQGNRNKDAPRRNAPVDTSTTNTLVVQDRIGGYDWSFQAEEGITNFALMAYTSQGSSSSDSELEEALKEKDDLKLKLENFEESSNNLTKLINSQISAKEKTGLGYDSQMNESEVVYSVFNCRESDVDDSLVNNRFKTGEGFHAVLPPYTGNYMPSRPDLSFAGLDDLSIRLKQVEYPRKSQSPRDNRRNWNGIMTQKLGNGFESIKKACFVCGSLNHLIKDCDFHENKMVEKPVLNNKGRVTGQREIRLVWNNAQRVNHQNKLTHPHPKRNFVPTAVATKSGQVPVNAAKQSSPRAATSISTARPVNTAAPKPKVNDALPTTYSYFKAHSPVRRAFNQKSAAKTNNFNEKVNTARVNNVTTAGPKAVVSAAVGNGENVVKSSACWIWRPTGNVIDHTSKDSGSYMLKRFDYGNPQYTLQDQGIFDSGCSRHMTGNKSFLTDYQEIDGGFVAFGGSPKGGKITGKGKIRTGKLDFEDVYFVKELKFNLFSVSQMCDKKNIVLFTETESRVLSPDFKLLDERGLTCLFAKATIDESNLWHRRLGHINFKNMNKLVKRNLVRGLLSKLFENDHTFVACQKEKQHKASCKTKLAEAVSTACYVQNTVLVTKPHNKTPYELLHARPPSICFMRPFGCLVTILNTLDPLGKFDGKADKGFFVGYSINSKAFRVFNTRTMKVEENLHITFLENKPNVAGSRPDWLFDIDLLANSMNYEPSSKDEIADDAGKKTNEEPANEAELDNLLVQQKQGYANSTNRVSTVSPSISAAGESFTNADDLPTDPLLPDLEDNADLLNTGIFSGAYDDEDEGAEAKLNNRETTMNVSPIPTTRIHKDHSKDQIIRDINLATQIRRMTKISKEHAMVFVDDIIFGSNKKSLCTEFESFMHKKFQMSSIGELTFFLGLQVMQRDDGIFISQDKYVADKLKKINFSSVITTSTPIETHKALHKDEKAEDVDVHLYRSMIGSLMYLTASRPDIMFAVCACARFQVTPKVSHLHAVKRIFRYLKGQPKLGLWYPRDSPFDLEAFSNSNYARAMVANSTTEAEYVAAANCCGQTVYKEWEDRMERAATTASSLEAEQDSEAQTRFEAASKQSNDPPLSRVNTLGSGEDNMKLKELMELYAGGLTLLPNTEIFDQLSLMGETIRQEVKIPQFNFPTQTPVADEAAFTGVDVVHRGNAINISSIDAGHGSDNITKSLTMPHDSPLLRGHTPGSDDGKDPSKQGRSMIEEMDLDGGISLVPPHVEVQRRYVQNLDTQEDTTADDLTLAETLIEIKKSAAKSKGKAKMDETESPRKMKQREQVQISRDAEVAQKLQEEFDAVAADEDFVQQAGKKCSEEDLPMKLVELVNQRKNFFAQQRAEAKRNKPMNPAQ
ncbi:ribonuclease H-like domain-containing protein [Tanacetum coccineum]|uniref:Ribonuclease H-like domain-containing protein n=1 Tax=Tanacetum coccineum TaxID=301880 RepID=A0ABQ4WYN9_9ASTR